MFQLQLDRSKKLMSIVIDGFLSEGDVLALGRVKADQTRAAGWTASGHSLLIDVTQCQAQSQAVIGAFMSIVEAANPPAARIAVVVTSALAGRQAGRVFDGRNVRRFSSVQEARDWAMEPGADVAS